LVGSGSCQDASAGMPSDAVDLTAMAGHGREQFPSAAPQPQSAGQFCFAGLVEWRPRPRYQRNQYVVFGTPGPLTRQQVLVRAGNQGLAFRGPEAQGLLRLVPDPCLSR